jgi:predicted  nucleic acid-binding Zn-ribbon protein
MKAQDSRALELQRMKLRERKQRLEQKQLDEQKRVRRIETQLDAAESHCTTCQQRLSEHHPHQSRGKLDIRSMSTFRIQRAGLSKELDQSKDRVAHLKRELQAAKRALSETTSNLRDLERDIEVLERAMEKREARARIKRNRKLDEPEP